jgi:hypothetical protein
MVATSGKKDPMVLKCFPGTICREDSVAIASQGRIWDKAVYGNRYSFYACLVIADHDGNLNNTPNHFS